MKDLLGNFFAWLKKQNEYLPMIIAVLVFYVSPYVLRAIDPTAGTYDVGVLQVIILTIIMFCVFQSVVWMALKVNWLSIRCYFEDRFSTDFKTLQPWQKIVISLCVYFSLLFALVLLSRVI